MLLLELQKLAEALVLLDGRNAVSRLLLSLGELCAQALVFRDKLVIFVQVAVYALEPLGKGADHLLYGSLDRTAHVLDKSGVALEQVCSCSDDESYDKHDDAQLYSVFLQILFNIQSSRTPIVFSIFPSLHSGRPITLK